MDDLYLDASNWDTYNHHEDHGEGYYDDESLEEDEKYSRCCNSGLGCSECLMVG